MYRIRLHGGPFHGRVLQRRHCHVGLPLMVSGSSERGVECELYRVRLACSGVFAATVDRSANDGWGQAFLG